MITNEELALMSVGQIELVSEGVEIGKFSTTQHFLMAMESELTALKNIDVHEDYIKGFQHAILLIQEVSK